MRYTKESRDKKRQILQKRAELVKKRSEIINTGRFGRPKGQKYERV